MDFRRCVLVLLLSGSAAVLLLIERSDEPAEEAAAVVRVKGRTSPLTLTTGLNLIPSSAEGRRLGIARANFAGGPEEPVPEDPPELSPEERKLTEAFKTGSLKRIGNVAVFVDPNASTNTPPEAARDPAGGGR